MAANSGAFARSIGDIGVYAISRSEMIISGADHSGRTRKRQAHDRDPAGACQNEREVCDVFNGWG
jgi:hypothetical protein